MARLILASGSARRAELLKQLGLSFEQFSPDIDETQKVAESAPDYVARLAKEKANTVLNDHLDATVIAADTCIFIDGQILGKPQSKQHAFTMWQQLSGRTHHVFTGVCVVNKEYQEYCVVETQVKFQQLSLNDMEYYWATEEPLGKAGGYAIQGIAACYIPEIKGSYTNVVGLPLHETVMLLKACLPQKEFL